MNETTMNREENEKKKTQQQTQRIQTKTKSSVKL